MFRPIQIWERYRDQWILAGCTVLSFLLMSIHDTRPVHTIQQIFLRVSGRVQTGISWIPRTVNLAARHRHLLSAYGALALRESMYREVLEENNRLRRMLGFMEQSADVVLPAQVVGIGGVYQPGSVTLNVGSSQGCRKDMALTTEHGVAGKLVHVQKQTSTGQLITDPDLRISGRIARSRVLGIVRWLYGSVCALEGVSQTADVRSGDLVVTSGFSQIYPAGLSIGRIFEVHPEKNGLYLRILLQLEAHLETVETLFVLKHAPV